MGGWIRGAQQRQEHGDPVGGAGAIRAGHDPDKVGRFLQIGVPITDAAPVTEIYGRMCS